ncbi:hypothetical protein [Olivibacter domesticus]|uniref:Uncharacterized protein n=1 Tax=Olivibacter domesticus TaxID=407022 RepID=A0A1H7MLT4_OLID1|nr:hypothetical protein [Olivibacter domesticus]SEL11577.1 hypothetical protein SAMN05661044_02041 [Olivibacter domesticus]
MKKMWSVRTVVVIITVFFTSLASAQLLALKGTTKPGAKRNAQSFDMVHNPDVPYDVNPRIINHFTKNFDASNKVKWYGIGDGVVAKFKRDSIPHAVTYNNDGNWMYTIKYYTKQNVPTNIAASVYKKFRNFSILRAREIMIPNISQPVYLVQIQNGNRYKELRINREGIYVLQALETAKTTQ